MNLRTPVIIGIAQLNQRIDGLSGEFGKEPFELMLEVIREAGHDAGCSDLGKLTDSIRVVRGMWPYENPAGAIAESLGANRAETCLTPYGGNFAQTTIRTTAEEIQNNERDFVIITGAECGNAKGRARKAGVRLEWQSLLGTPDRIIGKDVPLSHEREIALNIQAPIQVYSIFENALRYHKGRSPQEHLKHISTLWAGFSEVAKDNPHAWIREPKSAEEIQSLSAANRPVSVPYSVFLTSNSRVDQAAAIIMTSTETAQKLGISKDKWVYPWACTHADDIYFFSNRDNFYSSPAIRSAGARAMELVDMAPEEFDKIDLYSCFPVAVQVAAEELKLNGQDRPLTVTGGNTWGGGPMNDFVLHSTATMAEVMRNNRGEVGLVSAIGGYITKHEFCVYSTEPPAKPLQFDSTQAQVDSLPRRELAEQHEGEAIVDGYTAMYQGAEPAIGYVSALIDDGRRVWGICEDKDTLSAMTNEEFCGKSVLISGNTASF